MKERFNDVMISSFYSIVLIIFLFLTVTCIIPAIYYIISGKSWDNIINKLLHKSIYKFFSYNEY